MLKAFMVKAFMVKAGAGLTVMVLAGAILADAPASRRLNCFSGRVVSVAVASGAAPAIEFTIDPGPMGSYSVFQAVGAPAEVLAGWASMLSQAYLQNAVITIQYADPLRQPQPVGQIIFSHNAVANCTYRSPLPPIVSVQPPR